MGTVEDIGDQRIEPLHLLLDRGQLTRHELAVALDRRERSAQLVPEKRQQLVFGLQRLALAGDLAQEHHPRT